MSDRDRPRDEAEDVAFVDAPAEEVLPQGPVMIEQVVRPRHDAAGRRERRAWSAVTRLSTTLALAFLLALLILVWTGYQVTQRDNAERVLQRVLVPLTEIDSLMANEYTAILAEAAASEQPLFTLPHYPLPVAIPTAELVTLAPSELRARMLSASATLIYDEGISAFQREPGAGAGGVFSPRRITRFTMGRLTQDTHDIALLLGVIVLLLTVPLLIVVLALSRGRQRLRNVGLALVLGAVPMSLASVGARFGLRFTADGADDPLNAALLEIGADVTTIALRNYVIFALLGLALVALALGLGLRQGRAPAAAEGPV